MLSADFDHMVAVTIAGASIDDVPSHDVLLVITDEILRAWDSTGVDPLDMLTTGSGYECLSDGRDIRVCLDQYGVNQAPVDVRVVSLSATAADARLFAVARIPSASFVASTDLTVYLRWGDAAATMPARASSYGRAVCYEQWEYVKWALPVENAWAIDMAGHSDTNVLNGFDTIWDSEPRTVSVPYQRGTSTSSQHYRSGGYPYPAPGTQDFAWVSVDRWTSNVTSREMIDLLTPTGGAVDYLGSLNTSSANYMAVTSNDGSPHEHRIHQTAYTADVLYVSVAIRDGDSLWGNLNEEAANGTYTLTGFSGYSMSGNTRLRKRLTTVGDDFIFQGILYGAPNAAWIALLNDMFRAYSSSVSAGAITSVPALENTVTFTGLVAGGEFRIYDLDSADPQDQGTELAGTETLSGTTYAWEHSKAGDTVSVQLIAEGYEELVQTITLPTGDATIPLVPRVELNI